MAKERHDIRRGPSSAFLAGSACTITGEWREKTSEGKTRAAHRVSYPVYIAAVRTRTHWCSSVNLAAPHHMHVRVRARVRVCARACVCVCVCLRACLYLCMCVRAGVRACVRAAGFTASSSTDRREKLFAADAVVWPAYPAARNDQQPGP